MKKNIRNIERIVRIAAGLAILSLAFVGPQSPWAYLGVVPLLTGFVGCVHRMLFSGFPPVKPLVPPRMEVVRSNKTLRVLHKVNTRIYTDVDTLHRLFQPIFGRT